MRWVVGVCAALLVGCAGERTVYVTVDSTKPAPTTVARSTSSSSTTEPRVSAEDEFIWAIEQAYGPITMDDYEVIDTGRQTCSFLRGGASAYDLMDAIESSSYGDGREFVTVVVASAITYFCPDQAYKITDRGL